MSNEGAVLIAIDAVMAQHRGRENAVKFPELIRAVCGLMTPTKIGGRRLRKLIENERPGILFCTVDPGGYYLPAEDPVTRNREIRACLDSCQSYIKGMAARKASIIRAYPEAQQMELGL